MYAHTKTPTLFALDRNNNKKQKKKIHFTSMRKTKKKNHIWCCIAWYTGYNKKNKKF